MEKSLVFLIIALAIWYVVRRFLKGLKDDRGCRCGCSSCPMDMTCGEPKKDEPQDP